MGCGCDVFIWGHDKDTAIFRIAKLLLTFLRIFYCDK